MTTTPDTEPARQRAQAITAAARALDILGAQSVDDMIRVADWILDEHQTAEGEQPAPRIKLDPLGALGADIARMVNAERARNRRRPEQ